MRSAIAVLVIACLALPVYGASVVQRQANDSDRTAKLHKLMAERDRLGAELDRLARKMKPLGDEMGQVLKQIEETEHP